MNSEEKPTQTEWSSKGSLAEKADELPPIARMSIGDHLLELRWRIIICLLTFSASFIAAFFLLHRRMFTFITWPMMLAAEKSSNKASLLAKPVALGPTDAIVVAMKVSLVAGLAVASPVILYQLWSFVRPGLKSRERRATWPVLVAAPLCFLTGAAFGYFILIPPVTSFLMDHAAKMGVTPTWAIGKVCNYVLGLTASSGVIFELPLVVALLSALGVVTPAFLCGIRKYVIVGSFVLAALLTPPDIGSQAMLGVPLYVLYEISIVISRVIVRRRDLRQEEGT